MANTREIAAELRTMFETHKKRNCKKVDRTEKMYRKDIKSANYADYEEDNEQEIYYVEDSDENGNEMDEQYMNRGYENETYEAEREVENRRTESYNIRREPIRTRRTSKQQQENTNSIIVIEKEEVTREWDKHLIEWNIKLIRMRIEKLETRKIGNNGNNEGGQISYLAESNRLYRLLVKEQEKLLEKIDMNKRI